MAQAQLVSLQGVVEAITLPKSKICIKKAGTTPAF